MLNHAYFSSRTNWPLNANLLSKELQSLKEKGIAVLDLTESNPTRCGFRYPSDKILSTLSDSHNMAYCPTAKGMQEAREAVSRYYQKKGFEVDHDRIILTSSTSEAYSYLFRLLLNPGESVLVGQPSYPLFEFLIELNDAKMESYHLEYRHNTGRWAFDIESIERAIHSKTRAIIVVNPNNPTGSLISSEELAAVNSLCRKNQLALISDEVFNDYIFEQNPGRVLSLVNNRDVLSFSLGGLSKCLGLPQMKLGWIVVSGPQDLVHSALERLEVIADTYLSVNTPVQNALGSWLDLQPDVVLEIQGRLKDNLSYLNESILKEKTKDISLLNSEGGWYTVLKLPSSRPSEEEWVLEFLQKDHVWVHPGYFFDFPQEPFLVLSLLPEASVFQEGINRILRRVT